jgi:hypothetical protein
MSEPPAVRQAQRPRRGDGWSILDSLGARVLRETVAGQAEGDAGMSVQASTECCPRFEPEPWDDKVITWEKKRFLRNRILSFFHIPLNFGAVMKRSMAAIEAAGATPDDMVILSDENSLWGADVYIAISKDIPGARTTTLSGTFLTKVFEGPYLNMRNWITEMHSLVKVRGKVLQKLYFFYTTCPKCSKKYGKNYVVILAQL